MANAPIEKVEKDGRLYACIFRREIPVQDGVKFLTPSDYPLQVGLIQRSAGYTFRPHIHRDMHYEVNTTQEFLYIQRGRMRLKVYDFDWNMLYEGELHEGDFFFSVAGGHSFDVLEEVRLIEVKQGPYPGDDYAKRFKS